MKFFLKTVFLLFAVLIITLAVLYNKPPKKSEKKPARPISYTKKVPLHMHRISKRISQPSVTLQTTMKPKSANVERLKFDKIKTTVVQGNDALMASEHRMQLLDFIRQKEMTLFFDYIMENNININAKINKYGLRLIEILLKKDVSEAIRLFDLGARLDFEDRNLLLKLSGPCDSEAVAFLINLNLFDLTMNNLGENALLRAAMYGNTDTMNLFTDAGIEITPDRLGYNPLDELTRSAKITGDTLSFFLDRGFEIDDSHLVNALSIGNLDTLRTLVDSGASLNELVIDEGNAMDYALKKSRTDVNILKYLEQHGFVLYEHHLEIAKYNLKYDKDISESYETPNGKFVTYNSYFPHAETVYEYISSRLNQPRPD